MPKQVAWMGLRIDLHQGGNILVHLAKCVRESWVHASCSFTVKHCSLNGHNWLNRDRICATKEYHRKIHGSQGVEQILWLVSGLRCKIWMGLCLFTMYSNKVNHDLDLHFATKVPEHGAKNKGRSSSENKPGSVVRRVPPVWHVLFPNAGHTLSERRLRVLSGKI